MSSNIGKKGSIATRMREVRTSIGLTQEEMGESIGKSQQSWANYETGTSMPPVEVVMRLVERHEVNGDWLLTGSGEMTPQERPPSKEPSESKPYITEDLPDDFDPDTVTFVPVYGSPLGAGQSGNAAMVSVRGYMAWEKRWLRREAKITPSKAFVAQVYGQSMETKIENGDLVLGESREVVDHDGIYAVRFEDELFIKHVMKRRDSLVLISENNLYDRLELTKTDDFSVIGRIVAKVGAI